MQSLAIEIPREPLKTTGAVAAWCKANEIPADVVGQWVWVRFEGKPDNATRAALKGAGFRWCKRRGEWAHDCGKKSRRARGYTPREKYGAIPTARYARDEQEATR